MTEPNVIFICDYNVFRSFCAEYITKYKLKEKNLPYNNIFSAGIKAPKSFYRNTIIYKKLNEKFPGIIEFFGRTPKENMKLYPKTIYCLKEINKPKSLILGMNHNHTNFVKNNFEYKQNVKLLGEYSQNNEKIIQDPGFLTYDMMNKRSPRKLFMDLISRKDKVFYLDKSYDITIEKIEESIDNLIEKELLKQIILTKN